jgi:predicted lactoylglutathione lyase
MEPRISLVTLGVRDLARAQEFYAALGWYGQEVEETVFFQAGGLVLVLWSAEALAADSGASPTPGGVVLAQNLRTPHEVDLLLADAAAAGAVVTRPAAATFYGGYAGCFADPDGHVWEIAYNPGLPLAEDGTLILPDLS